MIITLDSFNSAFFLGGFFTYIITYHSVLVTKIEKKGKLKILNSCCKFIYYLSYVIPISLTKTIY